MLTLTPRVGAIVLPLLLLVGCAGDGEQAIAPGVPAPAATAAGPIRVAANFYPIEFLAARIGGSGAVVTGLTPPGTEPHDLALSGPTLANLSASDVVFYLGAGFQPDVERAVGNLSPDIARVDLLGAPGLNLLAAPADLGKESLSGGRDPHVWLDPLRMKSIALSVFAAYVQAAPEKAGEFQANLAALNADLDSLDAQLRQDIDACRQRVIVTSHAAFGYLADRYNLRQLAISGLSPDAEPDAKTLAEITDAARAAAVGTVYFEEALSPDLSETVAEAIGAEVDLLAALEFDPSEEFGAGSDYLTVMRANSQRLNKGLDCA
ncbi:MAG: metal ABC transporter substrate-binding protein [Sporichthyaceae bacterium]